MTPDPDAKEHSINNVDESDDEESAKNQKKNKKKESATADILFGGLDVVGDKSTAADDDAVEKPKPKNEESATVDLFGMDDFHNVPVQQQQHMDDHDDDGQHQDESAQVHMGDDDPLSFFNNEPAVPEKSPFRKSSIFVHPSASDPNVQQAALSAQQQQQRPQAKKSHKKRFTLSAPISEFDEYDPLSPHPSPPRSEHGDDNGASNGSGNGNAHGKNKHHKGHSASLSMDNFDVFDPCGSGQPSPRDDTAPMSAPVAMASSHGVGSVTFGDNEEYGNMLGGKNEEAVARANTPVVQSAEQVAAENAKYMSERLSSSETKLQWRIRVNQQAKIDLYAQQSSAEEANLEARRRAGSAIADSVKAWSMKNGAPRDIRALLSSLHNVLWDGARWTPITVADVVDFNSVKKRYRRALMIVHPDKVQGGTAEQQAIAETVFQTLKRAWDRFEASQ
eukprot:TRINITY_DN63864_c0_g1_i3.p1 TRINITY_DN63864_c0_g1~~TRINITY_DN63864_c0_g1_i3.p1  ORF type:complete len:449 (-),score=280.19 TRINITY_DN63864_c0_g1_i3:386-1732(-)